jgi:hypothetical protein
MKIKEKIINLCLFFFEVIYKRKYLIEVLFVKPEISKKFKKRDWLRNIFVFFGIPFVLASIIVNSFHGYLSLITVDSIFVAIAIFTPIMFNFMLATFSLDKELLVNEEDYKKVKKFTNNVSCIIIICLLTIFLILLKASLYQQIEIYDSILDFFIVWGLLITGFNLLRLLDNLNFIAKERLKEVRQRKK